jgi:hypothetical protein
VSQITTAESASAPTVPEKKPSESGAWLRDNAVLQPLNGTVFGSLLVAWVAIGASGSAAIVGALAVCIAVPVLGWFIGLPIMLMIALMAACLWLTGVLAIVSAWALTALTIGLVSLGARLLNR